MGWTPMGSSVTDLGGSPFINLMGFSSIRLSGSSVTNLGGFPNI